MTEVCENCDRPKATQEDYDTIPGGEGEHLCWSDWHSPCEPADWRALCLESRAEVARLQSIHSFIQSIIQSPETPMTLRCPRCGREDVACAMLTATAVSSCAEYQVKSMEDELAETKRHLGNILAVMCRDGGHYAEEHGNEQAVTHALARYYNLVADQDALRSVDAALNEFSCGYSADPAWTTESKDVVKAVQRAMSTLRSRLVDSELALFKANGRIFNLETVAEDQRQACVVAVQAWAAERERQAALKENQGVVGSPDMLRDEAEVARSIGELLKKTGLVHYIQRDTAT